MTTLSVVALSLAVTMAGLLLWAGLEKARAPAAAATTLRRLGLRSPLDRLAAVLLAATEIATGLALVVVPESVATQAAVAALALAFAAAGAVALARRERIPCSCLGSGAGTLGSRQVVTLGPWLGGAAFLALTLEVPSDPSAAAARLAVLGLGLAAIRGTVLWKAREQARDDRLTAAEVAAWRPSL